MPGGWQVRYVRVAILVPPLSNLQLSVDRQLALDDVRSSISTQMSNKFQSVTSEVEGRLAGMQKLMEDKLHQLEVRRHFHLPFELILLCNGL